VINDKYDSAMRKPVSTVLVPSAELGIKEPCTISSYDEKTFHDLRSSLNIIMGYTELMLEGLLGKMTDEQRESISDIMSTSRHMQSVLEEAAHRKTPAAR
jgi:light-regulated signal transduction histidine kinase (bacteriophytochrome)